jgi:zinc transport system substrate-binding protein
MDKKYFWFVAGLILVAVLSFAFKTGVFKNNTSEKSSTITQQKIAVVGTFYPLAHFAQQVGGDYVVVANITPAGAEPHDYEPTPQDIVKAYQAKVFVMNGGGVDIWAEKIGSDLQAKDITVVDMQKTIQLATAPAGAETQLDPHIWLDPVLAQQEVQLIRDAFITSDPAHADAYNHNAATYIAQLQALDSEYKTGLASCQLKDIVTSHAAFGYMAKRYGLTQIPIAGLSPDAEPSAQQIAQIVQLVEEKHIKYIFFETLLSPKLSQTIATETGAQAVAFNPLEGLTDEEIKAGKTYLTEMRSNLAELKIALQCK